MTAKEEATALVNKFYRLRPIEIMTIIEAGCAWDLAKKIAIICVDEIINAISQTYEDLAKEYWNEVKQELLKL